MVIHQYHQQALHTENDGSWQGAVNKKARLPSNRA